MLNIIRNFIKKDKGLLSPIYIIIISFVFALLYSLLDDIEFATWVDPEVINYNLGHQYINYIFDKYANKDGILTKNIFLDIPIYRGNDNLIHLINKHNELTKKKESVDLRNELFEIYKNNQNYITDTIFLKMPLSLKTIPSKDILKIVPNKYYNKYINKPIHGFKDRLYFAFVTQSLLGYGDIIPASNRVRFLVVLQIITSLYLLNI